jgi:tryptophan synthase alpha chain
VSVAATGIDRIAAAFASHGKRAALMPYLMGGHPGLDASVDAGLAAVDSGADLIELGIPFSDPLADGPVIHAAATEALERGATPHGVLRVCERLAEQVPVVLLVYVNVVMSAGAEAFALRAAAAGASGLIVPDLPHDEAGEVRAACDAEGLALVPLVAPTSTAARVGEIGADARGFVYTVSVTGTTGERDEIAPRLAKTVADVRGATDLPVAVGFGISTAAQARDVGELADGVVVGSRVVRASAEGGPRAVSALIEEFAEALR